MSIEARQHPRARAKIRVEYQFGATSGAGYTNDVSEGGLFLETDAPAPEGSRIYLRLFVPGERSNQPLKMIGIVRRQRESPEPGTPNGMGIRFEVAYTRARECLGGFIGEALTDPMTVRESTLDEAGEADDAETPPPPSVAAAAGSSSVWLWGFGGALIVAALLRLLL